MSTTKYDGGGIRGKSRMGKSRILFHFKAPLGLHCDTILTFLFSLHLSFSDLHLFSFSISLHPYAPVFFHFFSPQIVLLLRNLLASCSVALRVSCDINNFVNVARLLIVAVLILFTYLLSPLYLSFSLSPLTFLVHTRPYAAVSQCNVLQGHHCHGN